MKKFFAVVITTILCFFGFAQPLTGTKTIKTTGGDYSSFASAIASLNNNGVGAGGVTFDVDAGFIDSAVNLIISDTTATSSNPIVFQKAGTGNNPLIIAKAGTGNMDGIVKIIGTDYITFDHIDLIESSTNTTANAWMEWGYALLKSTTKNGCNHVVIKNCHITLNKSNTNATYGIYSSNHTITSTTDLVLADTSYCNSHNSFYSDTITNVFGGIYIKGSSSGSSKPIYDQGNMVGFYGGNYISNFNGKGTTTEAGIFGSYQNNMVISNNTINGGTGSTAPIYGIFTSNGTNSNIDIYNNTISLNSGATGFNATMSGIYNSIGSTGTSNTVNIYNNHIQNCRYAGTAGIVFSGITNTSSGNIVNIYDNIVASDTIGGTGAFTGINASTCTTLNFYSNEVSNNRKTGSSGSMSCFSMNSATINCYYNTAHDNSIVVGNGTLFGYTNLTSSLVTENVYSNKIFNLTHGGTGSVYGIYSYAAVTTLKQIYNDTIYSLSSAGGGVYGIYTAFGTDNRIYKNQITNLTSSTASGTAYGIYSNSNTTGYFYNNFISDLKTPASTNLSAVNGIIIYGGTNIYVIYNSVFLNASSTSATNFGSAALYATTGPTLLLKNNILVNISTAGPTGGKTSSYQRSTNNLTTYYNLSDNNSFYAGTPSSKNVIFYDGTNSDSTLILFKSRVNTSDVNSFSEKPPFINTTITPFDLHLATSIPTTCESAGTPFSTPISIINDLDGNARNTNFPDVGADEGNFTLLDQMQPRCTYSTFGNTVLTSVRQLTATIIDPSGVPKTGNGMPVLYWKKRLNGSWNNVQSTFSGSNDQFYFSFGSGVTTGDTIFYYIAAQDSATIPNTGVYPSVGASGFSANPPTASKPPTSPNYYVIIAGFPGGNYKIGGTGITPAAGCTYVDLTAALADISSREITGAIKLILTKYYSSNEEDTFPLIVKSVVGQDATNTITIKPDTNVITIISRSSATSIFKFDGAQYFIIDGSNNGTSSRDLTITNTSTSSSRAAIWIGSLGQGKGSTNINVKNCNISMGNSTATNYGIYISNNTTISSSTGGADNDNITLDNNQITKCNSGIFILATNTGTDDNLIISNNIIGSSVAGNLIGTNGIYLYTYINNATLIQNEVFGITTSNNSAYGIYIGNYITNSNFSKNKIHDIVCTGTGSVSGIYIISTFNSNLQFENNILYGIIGISYVYGICSNAGSNCSYYYNSVYLSGDRDALGTNKPTVPSYAFFSGTNASGLILKDNIFQNSLLAATNSTTAKSYAIYNGGSSTVYSAINYNDYFVSGTAGVFGYQGADIKTLPDWKTANSGDLNSISEDPEFNSPSNLQPSISSPVLAAGKPISGITTDINGNTRNLTKPSMGAYETGGDVTGPVINYIAFSNTSSTTARTLTAIITDPSGVPTSGIGLPVLNWKKNYAGVWTSITGISIGSDQYTFIFGSGVTAGDTVFYYVAAQDKYTTINVSVFPSSGAAGFTSNPPAISTPPTIASSYRIMGSISAGNYDIGGSGTTPCGTCTYVDLTAAINDISNKEIRGPISLSLTSFYKSNEEDAFPITINPLLGASATNTVTIKPASGTIDTITGNSTTSIIRLYGADYITIDGSNNGTNSRDLVIQNTSTSSSRATIQISSRGINNGATYNTIKNTIIMAGNYTTTNYAISIGNTIGGTGDDNDNISLLNNWFLRVNYGIFSAGTTSGMQDNLTINNNVFGDTALINSIGRYGIYILYNNGVNISNNSIFNINSTSSNASGIYTGYFSGNITNNTIGHFKCTGSSPTGIYLGSLVSKSKVIANYISDIKYTGTTQNGGGKGIDINTGNPTSNLLIANNMVSGIFGNGTGNLTSSAIVGIRIQPVTGGINVYNNTVNLYGKIARTGTSVNKNAALYIASTATALDIRNNIFTNSIFDTTGKNTSYAIYSDATVSSFLNLNFNNYFVSDSQSMLGYINFANDTTFQAWKTASGKDSNSFNVDPVYVSDVDLHISSVYLNSAGDTVSSVTDDIDGNPRFAIHPDIGADEFGLKAVATTLGSDQILGSKATVWGKVNPMNEYNTVVAFEYGTTTAYGFSAIAIQSPVQGLKDTTLNANLTGLIPQTNYHYRITATTSEGISFGKDSTFLTMVSIKEKQNVKDVTIYMNGRNIIVQLNRDNSNAQIMVYDLFGKEIFSSKIQGKQIQHDLGNSATGYYLVNIISDQMVVNKKVFIK